MPSGPSLHFPSLGVGKASICVFKCDAQGESTFKSVASFTSTREFYKLLCSGGGGELYTFIVIVSCGSHRRTEVERTTLKTAQTQPSQAIDP